MGGGDAPNGGASEGSERVKPSSQDSRDLNFLMASCYPISLKFIDICYRVKLEKKKSRGGLCRPMLGGPTKSSDRGSTTETIQEKTILNGVTGMACPGEILAVLGPSGSGKSTLLNALAGRIQGHCFTGTVLANGRKLTKPVLRRTGFVTQDDILYPHLTVRETLIFCSLLRLPNTLTKQEKISLADSVIAELGLAKCENTIIGNSFIRGVSGGERKRVSIAHEMLINPSLLILDEPTSGLDSTSAYRLVSTLVSLANKGKTHSNIHAPALQSSLPDVSLCARLVRRQMLVLWKGKPSHELLRNCWLHAVFSHEPS
uniref:ABC transporter domain-containing protein n=1 Tax=Vitis vinifera TaxID=29760 RepID=A5CAP7_VITVI|nr:hypothetical protein VITISV_026760 [Vitis vinifera]